MASCKVDPFFGEWSVKGRQESCLVSSSNLNLPRCRWSSCQLQLVSNQWLNRNYLQQHGVVLNQTYSRQVMANINCTTTISMSVLQAVASVLETYEIVVWSPTFAYLNNFHSQYHEQTHQIAHLQQNSSSIKASFTIKTKNSKKKQKSQPKNPTCSCHFGRIPYHHLSIIYQPNRNRSQPSPSFRTPNSHFTSATRTFNLKETNSFQLMFFFFSFHSRFVLLLLLLLPLALFQRIPNA